MADQKNQNNKNKVIASRYSYTKKGYRFEEKGKYDKVGDTYITNEDGTFTKPASSNSSIVMFDTGNAYIKGKCYDHHQLSQEKKQDIPSATALIYKTRKSFYEAHQNDVSIKYVTHDHPDNDAILSVALASMIMECKGELPACARDLVRIANESDTFTFKTGFNFGTLLTKVINDNYPTNPNARTAKCESIEACVNYVKRMAVVYGNYYEKETDPEKRKNLTMDTVLKKIVEKGSDFQRKCPNEYKQLRKFRTQIIEEDQKLQTKFQECLSNRISVKSRDMTQEKMVDQDYNRILGNSLSYDTFEVNLCKKQLTDEERKQPLEKSPKKAKVFVYTGTQKVSQELAQKASKQYDVVIFPTYDNKTKEVTMKISCSNPEYDMGHFGRYIETMLYKEKLDKETSTAKDNAQFEEEKRAFINRITPLSKDIERNHFTTYESLCGNDPTFFGYRVKSNSNLYSLQNLKSYMIDYLEEPEKITHKKFVNIIGKETFEEIELAKRPKRYKERLEEQKVAREKKLQEQQEQNKEQENININDNKQIEVIENVENVENVENINNQTNEEIIINANEPSTIKEETIIGKEINEVETIETSNEVLNDINEEKLIISEELIEELVNADLSIEDENQILNEIVAASNEELLLDDNINEIINEDEVETNVETETGDENANDSFDELD